MEATTVIDVPPVLMGRQADDSVAISVYVLVRHGVQQRPQLAGEMLGRVRLRLDEDYPAVIVDFRGDEIEVADEPDEPGCGCDLQLAGRLGDITALIAAPLAGGLPNPTTRNGRRAIARLADGRVELDGSLALARNLLRLLSVET